MDRGDVANSGIGNGRESESTRAGAHTVVPHTPRRGRPGPVHLLRGTASLGPLPSPHLRFAAGPFPPPDNHAVAAVFSKRTPGWASISAMKSHFSVSGPNWAPPSIHIPRLSVVYTPRRSPCHSVEITLHRCHLGHLVTFAPNVTEPGAGISDSWSLIPSGDTFCSSLPE